MRPLSISIILVLLLSFISSVGASATTGFAAQCQYVLGFKTVHDLIPDIVGDCLAGEHYAPNGDALQETSNGLLVWRKADNFTAFTDGYRSWVNGPFGLQQRLNTDRFPWERDGLVAGASATSDAGASQSTIAYLDWTFENEERLGSHLERVGLLLEALVDSDCACGADPTWRAAMIEALAELKAVAQEMQNYSDVPGPAAELHALSIAVGEGLVAYADGFVAAIGDDGVDLDAMVLAFEHLLQVSDTADRWYDTFLELDAEYS